LPRELVVYSLASKIFFNSSPSTLIALDSSKNCGLIKYCCCIPYAKAEIVEFLSILIVALVASKTRVPKALVSASK
jgi:hypothetical protein